jgi:predicted DNA-binding transcriptional regulator AlpA
MTTMRRPSGSEGIDPSQLATNHGQSPLLLTARQVAFLLGKSLRTLRTWDALGLIPRPMRIGRSTLWSLEELRAWVNSGCACRSKWEASKHNQHGG